MQYLGGKFRIARKFAPVIAEALATRDGRFVEPFVGGFNLAPPLGDAIRDGRYSDLHPGLITFYNALKHKTFEPPDEMSQERYNELRAECDWSNPLTAFAAFACSFGGKEWGGYARDKREYGKDKSEYNFAASAARRLYKKRAFMENASFNVLDYRDVMPRFCVVYADPPYEGTTGYNTPTIDYDEYWDWCRDLARRENRVFVSEFTAPPTHIPYREVWSDDRTIGLKSLAGKQPIKLDRLFEILP